VELFVRGSASTDPLEVLLAMQTEGFRKQMALCAQGTAAVDQNALMQNLASLPPGATNPYWQSVFPQAMPNYEMMACNRRLNWFANVDGLDSKMPRPHWKRPGLGMRSV